jgi:alpha-beta hydrolase superfamily lysophospholipase
VLLNANMVFLAIPNVINSGHNTPVSGGSNPSLAQNLSYISVAFSMGGIIVGLIILGSNPSSIEMAPAVVVCSCIFNLMCETDRTARMIFW